MPWSIADRRLQPYDEFSITQVFIVAVLSHQAFFDDSEVMMTTIGAYYRVISKHIAAEIGLKIFLTLRRAIEFFRSSAHQCFNSEYSTQELMSLSKWYLASSKIDNAFLL
jgi:hypothetical protein